jgi:hypothetical protein
MTGVFLRRASMPRQNQRRSGQSTKFGMVFPIAGSGMLAFWLFPIPRITYGKAPLMRSWAVALLKSGPRFKPQERKTRAEFIRRA